MTNPKIKTIVADPPWFMCTGGSKTVNPKDHYPVQKTEDIIKTLQDWMVEYPVAPEAHLYLWTINSFNSGNSKGILDGYEVCRALGFNPVTCIVWVKDNNSNPTPYGQRATELCIFAERHRKGLHKEVMYRGSGKPENVVGKGLTSSLDYLIAPRKEHSRKPSEFYDFVENRSRGPYLECYSRTNRQNWISAGNQVGTWTFIEEEKDQSVFDLFGGKKDGS